MRASVLQRRLRGGLLSERAVASQVSVLAPAGESGPIVDLLTGNGMVWYVLAHVLLGSIVFVWRPMATVHAWIILGAGIWVALSSRQPQRMAEIAAYIVSAEVLWRMGRATIFWETGKYAIVAILLIGLARFGRTKPAVLAMMYFALLVPGIFVATEVAADPEALRQQISFNLSGPLSLLIAAYFFKQLPISREQLANMAAIALGPIVAIATQTIASTYTATDLLFLQVSNAATSGGFGPNQVSGVLSMGALMSFLVLVTLTNLGVRIRGLLLIVLVICGVQSAMTFSRGGLYMAAIAMTTSSIVLLGDPSRRRLVIAMACGLALAFALIVPQLDEFTGGALTTRFQDADLTKRDELMRSELQVWSENPWMGVGVGQGAQLRTDRQLGGVAAHTEWTRMLAEHGALGFVSMLVLLGMMVGALLRARGPLDKAVVLALMVWSASFLTINAMRVAAPGFLIGLGCATFELSGKLKPVLWRRRTIRAQR